MKLTDLSEPEGTQFHLVGGSSHFVYGRTLYLKLDNPINVKGVLADAIRLADGFFVEFDKERIVFPVDLVEVSYQLHQCCKAFSLYGEF